MTELYQNISVSGVATVANPNLTPEQDFNGELNIERHWDDGRVRLTGFYERTNNAIISQTNLVTNPATGAQVPTTTIGNVQAIRMQGVEASADKDNVWLKGLRLFGSVTYVDSRILYDPTWAGTNPLTGAPDTADGKRVPYVPDWRATAGFTYSRTKLGVDGRRPLQRQAIFDARQHRHRLPRLRRIRQLLRRRHQDPLRGGQERLVRFRHR